jgi:hypothetical protein
LGFPVAKWVKSGASKSVNSGNLREGDTRTDFLKKRIDGFKDQTSRLKDVLRKHQDAERRKQALQKQNRGNRSA